MLLEFLRDQVCRLHAELPRNHLVSWTSGNISGRDPTSGLVVIKPSGILYPDLRPENMVVVDLNGKIIEGELKPSSDTTTHLYIYRQRADVNGIVHTHSPFATAFATVGKPIPPVLTAICDEFGGEIPVGGFASIGDEAIGQEVIRSIGQSPAILMQNHGVFTIGQNPVAAVKAAVMVEDAARTVYYAMQLGTPLPIPAEMVARLHKRYTEQYGQ
ncbi:MAG: class II aldolase/adducin family protein [Anaerolineales bacterium]|nr:class II aldolase/adducin family protein [Anaerolineales bacterium]